MSTPTQMNEPGLDRRQEASVSAAAMSQAPWTGAAVTGGVVALGDFGWHVIAGHFGLGGFSDALSLGVLAFLVVAASGALLRERSSRAVRWARANPWRFALLPGVACAAIVIAVSVVLGGGIVGPVLAGLWHGAVAFGLTGAVGSYTRSRKPRSRI
ncbi:MAG TPA: hypothetical protein VG268_15260 [Streptosporangiaceae bacterium]|jgi:hypothetical protein|nr:hypothetical protein [Streptosporangiaceae bacterium]